MFSRQKETRVKPIIELSDGNEGHTLERSLLPLWMFSYFGGMTFGWCKEIENKSRASVTIRWILIFISFFLLIFAFGFQFYQLSMEIAKSNSTISSIMPNLLWFSSHPPAITTGLILLIKQKDFILLFKDWAALEMQQKLKIPSKRVLLVYFVYGGYGLFFVGGFISATFLIISKPEASYLLSFYKIIKDTLTIPGVVAFHIVSQFDAYVLNFIADLAPAWTFYHAGLILRSLSNEVENHFLVVSSSTGESMSKTASSFQTIRIRYETLNQLTGRANRLFGWLSIVNYGVLLTVVCSESYIVFSNIRSYNLFTSFHFLIMVIYILRLLIPFLLASQLETSSEKFKLSVSISLAGATNLSLEESKKWELFLFRLNEGPLAARPLDLFQMSPSLVLTITNLIITYVIVLLQSNNSI